MELKGRVEIGQSKGKNRKRVSKGLEVTRGSGVSRKTANERIGC